MKARSELYAGARHGYAVEGMAAFDQAASERHWRTLLELFDRNLEG